MTLPNFIIVGAARAGTTTISELLDQHPEVGMAIMKEPNFFSDGWPNWATTLEEYESLFSHCAGKKAVGEASPFYFPDLTSAGKIRAALGDSVRIIITLRNPAKRAYSHWTIYHYKHDREPLSFHEALEREDERANSEEVRRLRYYYPGIFRYVWVSKYSDKVQLYLDTFGRENVKVIILEDFLLSPQKNFAELCEFLKIDPAFSPNWLHANAGTETSSPLLTKLVSVINWSPVFNYVYRKMPFVLKRFIFNLGNAIFESVQRPLKKNAAEEENQLDPETYQRLMKIFLPDIHNLEKILDRDLSIWYRDVDQ